MGFLQPFKLFIVVTLLKLRAWLPMLQAGRVKSAPLPTGSPQFLLVKYGEMPIWLMNSPCLVLNSPCFLFSSENTPICFFYVKSQQASHSCHLPHRPSVATTAFLPSLPSPRRVFPPRRNRQRCGGRTSACVKAEEWNPIRVEALNF